MERQTSGDAVATLVKLPVLEVRARPGYHTDGLLFPGTTALVSPIFPRRMTKGYSEPGPSFLTEE